MCALVLSLALPSAALAVQDPPPVQPPVPVPAPPVTPPQSAPPATLPQTTPPQTAPPEAQPPAPSPLPSPAEPPRLDEATVKQRRREIRNMEGVLASAVRGAAYEIALELESPEAGPFVLSGAHAARGFILDGYGVFFHVEIPGVQPALISPAALMLLEERFRRRQAEPAQPETASSGTAVPAGAPVNRNAVYVERVRDALMRAMIQYSKPLALRPDEWLTVAASDGDEPLAPTVLSEQAIMVLRIRGRDINDYLAERVSLDEVLKRVEVRKF
jgi:hypothetical protein